MLRPPVDAGAIAVLNCFSIVSKLAKLERHGTDGRGGSAILDLASKKKKKKWKKLHVRKKDGTDLNGGGLVEASEAPSSD